MEVLTGAWHRAEDKRYKTQGTKEWIRLYFLFFIKIESIERQIEGLNEKQYLA
jgi:hypothetical protein